MKTFCLRLKETREDKQLTQNELSLLTGLKPTAISHFETGNRLPSFDNLRKLCVGLGVSADYLLGLHENKNIVDEQGQLIELLRDQIVDLLDIAYPDERT